jgi:KDO2-lipid IV(A) lauroyltransferase
MKAAFPDKNNVELRKMEKGFYRHFADYIVETIKLAHISKEEINRRAVINNPEVIDRLMDEGHPCVFCLMGHCGNWEWYTSSANYMKAGTIYQIYRPLKNKAFDELLKYLRTRFGSKGIMKHEALRDIINLKRSNEKSLVIFLADQTPSRANIHFWTRFLNQDTAMINGPERIAKKLNLPVVFLDIMEPQRGFYRIDMIPITDNPSQTPDNFITSRYAELLERNIEREPALWLWSHNRWKYKKEDFV